MRKIDKQEAPDIFSNFVKKNKPTKWTRDQIPQDTSRAWRAYILEQEQYGIGGYTERPITLLESHIDHFRKREFQWPDAVNSIVFCWRNFVVEDLRDDYGARYKDKHTHSMADYDLLIDPVEENPARYFTYMTNGEIVASPGLTEEDTLKANFTISRFNLNHSELCQYAAH